MGAATNGTKPLNLRQQTFALQYLAGPEGIRGNATQAAIAAGYSPDTAPQIASRLLPNVKVATLIANTSQGALEKAEAQLIDWAKMLPQAAEAYGDLVQDRDPFARFARLTAAREIVERVVGKVPQTMRASGDMTLKIVVSHE